MNKIQKIKFRLTNQNKFILRLGDHTDSEKSKQNCHISANFGPTSKMFKVI
jgi:hypothetical protein